MQVPRDERSVIKVNCKWSNTANTLQAISMDEDDTSDNVLDSIDSDDSMQVTVYMFSCLKSVSNILHCKCKTYCDHAYTIVDLHWRQHHVH